MISICIYAASFGFWAFAQYKDARISEVGFAKGYIESNEVATTILRTQRPSFLQLTLFNFGQLAVFSSVAFFIGWPGAIAAALAIGGKHLMAVRKWRKAFATNGASLLEANSAWQKFLGL